MKESEIIRKCIICHSHLQNIEYNWNGAEWCCPEHTNQEWQEWCES
jgi:hypothetical protein